MAEGCLLGAAAPALRLAGAEAVLDGTLNAAHGAGLLQFAIVVRDTGAQRVALRRKDGCGVLCF